MNLPTLGQAVLELITDSSKLDKGLTDAEQKAQSFGNKLTLAVAATGVLAFGLATKAAINFESAFTDVRKTVEASETEFAAFEAGLRSMSQEIPKSSASLATLMGIAGQLGIENEHLLSFTRTMADLGVATNLTSEHAAIMLARFANVMTMDQSQFSNLGSSIVALGNALATTEAEIAQFSVRIAGAGKIAGMTEADLLGISAALSSVGVEAEAGGTAVQKVLLNITEAVVTGSDELETYGRTAGMSAQAFAKAWRDDPSQAFVAFVEGLGAAGQDAFLILDELDLHDQRLIRSFLSLAGAGDLLNDSIVLANKAFSENTELTLEAERRYATTASELQIMKNALVDIGITYGNAVTPALGEAAEALAGFMGLFGSMPDGTQQLILLGMTITSIGPLAVKMGASVIGVFTNINAATGKSRMGLLAWGVGLTAVLVGLDVLLQKTTGGGLMENIFGDVNKARRAKESLEEFNAEVLAAGPNVDKVALSIRLLGDNQVKLDEINNRVVDSFDAATTKVWAHGSAIKDLEVRTQVLGQQMVDNGATVVQMKAIYDQLDPSLQAHFDATTNITLAWEKYALAAQQGPDVLERLAAAQKKAKDSQVEALKPTHDLTEALGGYGTILEIVGLKTETSFTAWKGAIPPVIASTKELSEFLKEEFGTEVAAAFDDLVDSVETSFEEITEAYDSIIPDVDETFTDWKARLEKMAADHATFETSLLIIWGHLKESGIALPEAMLQAIAEKGPVYAANFAKLFAEDPQLALDTLKIGADRVTGETVDAMVNRITEGAPEYSTAVNSMLIRPWTASRTEVEEAAAALAIAQHDALITGINDPTAVARSTSAFAHIGAQLTFGLAGGMDSPAARASVTAAAEKVIDLAKTVMRSVGIIDSPSALIRDEVGIPLVEGLVVGMLSRDSFITEAARHIVSVAADGFNAAVAKDFPAATKTPFVNQYGDAVPDYVLKNSPYLSGLLENPEALITDNSLPGGVNWVFDPMKGGWTVGPTTPEVIPEKFHFDPIRGGLFGPGESYPNLPPLNITLTLDGEVIAQKVVDPWLDKQVTTEAASWGMIE